MGFLVFSYSFGLGAGFLLDDYATLPYLGQWGEVNTFSKFKEFIGSGFTGPTGRPVTLVSFLLNSNEWPTEPRYFLVTNLAIHLANTCLAYLFLRRFLTLVKQKNAALIALFSGLIWAAHPYLVSTVLYIVQRMVLLAVFFNLLALIFYLAARSRLVGGRARASGPMWFLAVLCSILAVASKEISILIPLQVGLIELTLAAFKVAPLYRHKSDPLIVGHSLCRWLFGFGVLLPTAVIALYLFIPLCYELGHWLQSGQAGPSVREFTLTERLLTQQRVVGDYLRAFFLPPIQTAGVFWDGYGWSRSLRNPISTLVWSIVHLVLVISAFSFRKRLPLVGFGVLWFYIGHILESSTVMLELKFEHRTYLPFLGLSLAATALLFSVPYSIRYKTAVLAGIFACLCFLLFMRASLWGKPEKSYLVWMNENPSSTRAIESALVAYSSMNNTEELIPLLLEKAISHHNAQPGIYLQAFTYSCSKGLQLPVNYDEIKTRLKTGSRDWRVESMLRILLQEILHGRCSVSLSQFKQLTRAVLQNGKYDGTGVPVAISSLQAEAELVMGDTALAESYFMAQEHGKLPLSLLMNQSLFMANHGSIKVAAQNLRAGLQQPFEASEYLIEQAEDMLSKIEKDIKIESDDE
ncbi:hypothetical protein [Halioxenophilus aromaticivorans]|uniref:hypothetical protein n=1 Tax=Halioxenophilus aromaticivorans TaxID=1306992 RepID=UPI0031EE4EF4